MSYVFSKALTKHDDEERLRRQSLNIPNKIPPPVFSKPVVNRSSQQPPAVKRKPLARSASVDSTHNSISSNRNSIDLTVVGGSEWKDFVIQRQKQRESEEARQEEEADSRRSSTSSSTSSCSKDGSELTTGQTGRSPSTSSSTSSDETTGQAQSRRQRHSSSSSSGKIRTQSIDLTQVGDGEWKRRSEELQEKERAEEERLNQELNQEAVEPSQNAIDETQDTTENVATTKTTELFAVPEEINMDQKANSSVHPPVTLPKPRKLNAELKRTTFSRSSSSSATKSFSVGESAPVIKRSSDLLKDSLNAPRNERSLSFDTQTPYFCRQSRQLTLELEETLAQCEQELNETLIARKATHVGSSSVLPISEVSEGEPDIDKIRDINEIEHSPDVVAMKNEIAIERSKIGSERQHLSDTIDEIENMDFDFNALVKPALEEDVFVEAGTSDETHTSDDSENTCLPTQTPSANDSLQKPVEKTEIESTEGQLDNGVVETSLVQTGEALPAPSNTEIASEVKSSEETALQPQTQSNDNCDPPVEQNNDEPCGENLGAQTDTDTVNQVLEKSTSHLPISDQMLVEPVTSAIPSPHIETGSNENLEPSTDKKESDSTSHPESCIDSPNASETTAEVSLQTEMPRDEILEPTVEENQQEVAIGQLDIQENTDTSATTSLEHTEGSAPRIETGDTHVTPDITVVDKHIESSANIALNQSEDTVDHSTTETNSETTVTVEDTTDNVLVEESTDLTARADPGDVETINQCEPVISQIESVDTDVVRNEDEIILDKREDGHIHSDIKSSDDIEVSTNENVLLDPQSDITSESQSESESVHSTEINGTVVAAEGTNEQMTETTKPDVSNEELSKTSPEVADESSKSCNKPLQVNGDVPSNITTHISENGFTEKIVFV